MITTCPEHLGQIHDRGSPTHDMVAPFKCSLCPQKFKRSDHLKRHTDLHTNRTKYQCHCGHVFVRPEVLGQHLRSCRVSQNRQDHDPNKKLSKSTRSKKACDKCASMKLKCDSQQPCGRCRSKSIECKYTRGGYADRYEAYRIRSEDDHFFNADDFDRPTSVSSLQEPYRKALLDVHQRVHKMGTALDQYTWPISETSSDSQVPGVSGGFPTLAAPSTNGFDLAPALPNLDFELGNSLLPNFDSTSWFFSPFADLNPTDLPDLEEDQPPTVNHFSGTVSHKRGFSLEQSDPVEAKCTAVRALMHRCGPVYAESVAVLSARETFLQCHKLYGAHFQYHYPLLHVPTHCLTEASPVLLSAMMLTGALYSRTIILTSHISRIALRLLIVILNDPAEMNLGKPDIPTVQACLILCMLLGLSRDYVANQSWSLLFPRVHSMAERLGAFKIEDPVNDNNLTLEAFDWASWIRQESLRRIACQIFCHDIGGCIMIRRPPSLPPLSANTMLPSYESAWEAETAAECLQELQKLPTQITISGALKALLNRPFIGPDPHSEVSGYGMFVLIHGIHGLVFQLTREELAPFLTSGESGLNLGLGRSSEASILMERLKNYLSSSTVEIVADAIINANPNAAFQRLNAALNAWKTSWDNRKFRDHFSDNRSFSASPMPYWFLAKLFIALHLLAMECPKPDDLQIWRLAIGYPEGTILIQDKITSWLQKFKSEGREIAIEPGPEAPEINTSAEESRVLTMMNPL